MSRQDAVGDPRCGRRRRASYRLVKVHRNYEVDEAATMLAVSRGTVRRWIKSGALPVIMDKKPYLVLGGELFDLLKARSAPKARLALHQCFCFTCRAPRGPAGGMVDYLPLTPTTGNIIALCEVCCTAMNKAISASALPELQRLFALSFPPAERHLVDTPKPSLNDHLQ